MLIWDVLCRHAEQADQKGTAAHQGGGQLLSPEGKPFALALIFQIPLWKGNEELSKRKEERWRLSAERAKITWRRWQGPVLPQCEPSGGVQEALADLVVGWQKHRSPHCALLLLRLAQASRMQVFSLNHDAQQVFGAEVTVASLFDKVNNKEDPFKDPATLVATYPDARNALYGDEVAFSSPQK